MMEKELYCASCGRFHKAGDMAKRPTTSGTLKHICKPCKAKMEKKALRKESVKRANNKAMQKMYREGGRKLEEFLKLVTEGD